MFTVPATWLFLVVFSWLKMGTLSENDIEVNPCHSLPSNATQEDVTDASFYCKLVYYEVMKDQAEYVKNPHCSPSFGVECTPRYTSYGIMDRKYRCTNAVKLWTSCANPVPLYWKGELTKCAVAEKYWSEPKAFYVTRKTPLEELERIYNDLILRSDMLLNTWKEKGEYSAHFAIQGSREGMEDTFIIQETIEEIKGAYFAVFDGHGGNQAAEFARKNLWRYLVKEVKNSRETKELNFQPMSLKLPPAQSQQKSKFIIDGIDYKAALKKAVEKTDAELEKRTLINNCGSTALIALIVGSKLIVANVGDSRGVMCDHMGNAKPISIDQKPGDKREKARIIAAGGQVIFDGDTLRLNGNLAMSRALGDFELKREKHLISEPDVRIYDLCRYKPQFLVLATDGLWDALSNEQVVAFIKNRFLEEYYGAKSLAYFAHFRGSADNISITVVNLKDKNWSCCSPQSRRQSQRCNEYFSRYARSSSSGSESNRSSWSFKSSASSIRKKLSNLWPRNRNSKRAGSSPPSSP